MISGDITKFFSKKMKIKSELKLITRNNNEDCSEFKITF